jgi:hypothetical protein
MRFLNTLRTLIDDRLLIMLLPALLVIVTDQPVLYSLGYAVAIVVAIVAVAHSLRLLLLPYVSLSKLVEAASENAMAAAVVFTSVLVFMGVIVHAMVAWIQAAAGH